MALISEKIKTIGHDRQIEQIMAEYEKERHFR